VEVMNLMDVLTSMDREISTPTFQFRWKDPVGYVAKQMKEMKKSVFSRSKKPGLDEISFIPSGAAVKYKEVLASRGNAKSRLPRMRDWGPRTAR
jgi:hypothetical protein